MSVISPGQRRRRASTKPSRAESAFPLGDYLVPASDPMGRSCSMAVTMGPDSRRACSTLLAKGLFGFQNEQDVLRWCIYHGLNELGKRSKDKEVVSEVSLLNNLVRQASIELEFSFYKKILDKLGKAIDVLLQEGHAGKAENLAHQIWTNTDKIDDPYWKQKYREMAKSKLDFVKRKNGEHR